MGPWKKSVCQCTLDSLRRSFPSESGQRVRHHHKVVSLLTTKRAHLHRYMTNFLPRTLEKKNYYSNTLGW